MSLNTMLPALAHPRTHVTGQVIPAQPDPDLTALGYLDFTGQWHTEETLAVFRPCLTLAVDGQGRRWIVETRRAQGLPGPVWCVMQDPQVAVYVSDDLGTFLNELHRHTYAHSLAGWLQSIDAAAVHAWKHRGALAFQSRQDCGYDREVRAWLLQLPRDSRVYDLRSAAFGEGWPYGVAGNAGRFHRCGSELLFAVSGFPAPTRRAEYLENLAQHHETPLPDLIAYERNRGVAPAVRQQATSTEIRLCA